MSSFGMWSRHWKTTDPRAERELDLRPDRFSFKRESKNQIHGATGSRKGETKFDCFHWRDTLVPALTCVQVRYRDQV